MTLESSPLLPAAAHPLEMIPLFRRWPVSHPRNLLYTGIWSGAPGLLLGVVSMTVDGGRQPMASYLAPMMLISLIIGYLVHGASLLGNLALKRWPRHRFAAPAVSPGAGGRLRGAGNRLRSVSDEGPEPVAVSEG